MRAKTFIAAGGAIGTPALLLRSKVPDPHGIVGKRTFLHPTVVSAAMMPERVDGFAGAPQTIYSDHFLDTLPLDGPIGYKLEAPPLHPILVATTLPGFGAAHAGWMRDLPHMQVLIALMRDGFHTRKRWRLGRLAGRRHAGARLSAQRLFLERRAARVATMAEIQFAAGAKTVMPVQELGAHYSTWGEAKAGIEAATLAPLGDHRGQRACHGRLPARARRRSAPWSIRPGVTTSSTIFTYSTGRSFPRASAPIRNCRSTAIVAKLASDLALPAEAG